MYRGSQFCKSEKAEFDQCRATPSGSTANPQFCESKVANFLQCYHDMVSDSRANCSGKFEMALNCMRSNIGAKEGSGAEGVCSSALNDFSNCKATL